MELRNAQMIPAIKDLSALIAFYSHCSQEYGWWKASFTDEKQRGPRFSVMEIPVSDTIFQEISTIIQQTGASLYSPPLAWRARL